MANENGRAQDYVLGIDLGSASLGWAAIGLEQHGNPSKLLRTGVRIFDPGVTGDIEKGQDESNAVARRAARLVRRQFRRRAARQRDLFRLLQRHGLLPPYLGPEADASEQRHSILNALDKEITAKWSKESSGDSQAAIDLPLYLLRKAALDRELKPFELGRVFYHLSQRRGYRSNRKEKAGKADSLPKQKQDDLGQVESDIQTLVDEMRRAGARTLGEYFACLNPHEQRVRRRWTGRRMYEDEFAAIWEKQASYHPEVLTEALNREIKRLLFYQRPIKEQAHLIGECELERGERRAAWATLEAQEFRVLQKVNDLEIVYPGQVTGVPLTDEQRQIVLNLLQNCTEATFKRIRKALGIPENVGFNLQRGGETRLKGNTTNAHLNEAFGERWSTMSDDEKRQVVEDWRNIEREESLIRRAVDYWELDEAGAEWLARRPAPNGYCSLSRKAIRKLLPLMRAGKRFKEAEAEVYGSRFSGGQVYDRVPPVRQALKTLRNPAIERSLTELRKVVNALIGEYGKPTEIRIELARDLKKPRKERAQATNRIRSREKERAAVKAKLLRELGSAFEHPSRADIEKALLHEECGGICPYSGRSIDFASLFGQNPQFDVEHIIPFSRIPDDSFQNKTLCYHEENRLVKRNRTPFEAYKEPEQYAAICDRVRGWPKQNLGKLARFELCTTEQLEGFSSRQLNDTRYASKLACELLGTLYGGRDIETDSGLHQVVFASSGMVTATLRRGWGLEAILRETEASWNGLNKGKPRADHRHHAIDAITIALSRPKLVALLSRANSEDPYWPRNGRTAPKIQAPWRNFVDSIRPHIERILVSHRPEHRLNGALHDETNYGRPHKEGTRDVVHIRRTVSGLSATDIENIVDPAIREAIRAKAAENGGDLKNWTPNSEGTDWPMLTTKAGVRIPIKRARVKKSLSVQPIGQGLRTRNVALASNHHYAIYAILDPYGKEARWDCGIVSLFEAMDRRRRSVPVVQTCIPGTPKAVFKFHLMWGDVLLLHKNCDHNKNICSPSYWRVRSIWEQGTLTLVRLNDARLLTEIRAAKDWLLPSADTLRKLQAVKVAIDSVGRCHTAGA